MLTIEKTDARHPEAARLLEASQDLMRALFDPGQCNYLSLETLTAPHIDLWAARSADTYLGVAALAHMGTHGEVKSLFVSPEARGSGTGRALLSHVETRARALNLPCLKLETGPGLDPAIALYESAGFRRTGPFGNHTRPIAGIAASIFMEKPLTD